MSIYKRYSDETKCMKCMYFMLKNENNFDKYMIICEKLPIC